MEYFAASNSAPSPSEIVHSLGMRGLTIRQPSVVEKSVSLVRAYPRSGLSITHGARDIDSTPPAMHTEWSPTAMARLAAITDSSPEPQSLLTVVPGTLGGTPASR